MNDDGWSIANLAREARSNVFSSRSRVFFLLVIAVFIGAATASFVAIETVSFRETLKDLAALGRNVVTFQGAIPNAPTTIERQSCEDLARYPGVERAGLLVPGGRATLTSLGTGLPVVRASTSLFPALGTADIAVGNALRDASGEHFRVIGPQASTLLAVGAPPEPDAIGTNSSVVVPLQLSDRLGATCVVVLKPLSDAAGSVPALAAHLTTFGNAVGARLALPDTISPVTTYLNRPGRYFPIIIALMGALAYGLIARHRASEFSVYRLSGTSQRSTLVLLALESLLISGAMALSSIISGSVLAVLIQSIAPLLWGVVGAAVWALGSIAFTVDIAFRRPTDMAKDR